MYLIEKTMKDQMGEGSAFRSSAKFSNIPIPIIEESDSCELWGTAFGDPGPDYCEFRFFKGDKVTVIRVNGY